MSARVISKNPCGNLCVLVEKKRAPASREMLCQHSRNTTAAEYSGTLWRSRPRASNVFALFSWCSHPVIVERIKEGSAGRRIIHGAHKASGRITWYTRANGVQPRNHQAFMRS